MTVQKSVIARDVKASSSTIDFDPPFPEHFVVGINPHTPKGMSSVTVYDEIVWIDSGGVVRGLDGARPKDHTAGTKAVALGIADPEEGE